MFSLLWVLNLLIWILVSTVRFCFCFYFFEWKWMDYWGFLRGLGDYLSHFTHGGEGGTTHTSMIRLSWLVTSRTGLGEGTWPRSNHRDFGPEPTLPLLLFVLFCFPVTCNLLELSHWKTEKQGESSLAFTGYVMLCYVYVKHKPFHKNVPCRHSCSNCETAKQ